MLSLSFPLPIAIYNRMNNLVADMEYCELDPADDAEYAGTLDMEVVHRYNTEKGLTIQPLPDLRALWLKLSSGLPMTSTLLVILKRRIHSRISMRYSKIWHNGQLTFSITINQNCTDKERAIECIDVRVTEDIMDLFTMHRC